MEHLKLPVLWQLTEFAQRNKLKNTNLLSCKIIFLKISLKNEEILFDLNSEAVKNALRNCPNGDYVIAAIKKYNEDLSDCASFSVGQITFLVRFAFQCFLYKTVVYLILAIERNQMQIDFHREKHLFFKQAANAPHPFATSILHLLHKSCCKRKCEKFEEMCCSLGEETCKKHEWLVFKRRDGDVSEKSSSLHVVENKIVAVKRKRDEYEHAEEKKEAKEKEEEEKERIEKKENGDKKKKTSNSSYC